MSVHLHLRASAVGMASAVLAMAGSAGAQPWTGRPVSGAAARPSTGAPPAHTPQPHAAPASPAMRTSEPAADVTGPYTDTSSQGGFSNLSGSTGASIALPAAPSPPTPAPPGGAPSGGEVPGP